MDLFADILLKVTLPIVALVALGYVTQPKLKVDVGSLNRLQLFVVLPCFFIHYLSTATQPISAVWPTVTFTLVQFAMLIALGWVATRAFRLERSLAPVMALATVYANVGFYGIPVVQLAFPPEFILHQSIITALMTILIVTVGVWMLAPEGGGQGLFGRLRLAFDTRVIPAVAVGLLLRGFEVTLPAVLSVPVQLMGMIFTPLALYTLGAQLADSGKGTVTLGPLSLVTVLKLLIAPAATWALALAMGLPDDLTDLVVVAAATPVGLLLAIFCSEFGRHPGLVARAILVTTALSPIFVTAWILLVRLI